MIRAMKVAFVAIAVAALACTALASGGTSAGTIVFAATDAPLNDDVTLVRADGSVLDLSNSGALDTAPVLSPNGKLVAFYSERGGTDAEYVVGVDGRGLRRITPRLPGIPSVAWAPSSRELAVVADGLFRANLDGGWTRLDRRSVSPASQLVGWSPDGKRIAYIDTLDDVRVVAPDGRIERTFNGLAAKWSPTGRLAVDRDNTIWQVYDMSGRRLSTVSAPAGVTWSPDGMLASMSIGGKLQIRRGGAGRPILTTRPVRSGTDPAWIDETHILIRGPDDNVIYDVVHRSTFLAPAAYRIAPAIAPDGTALGEYPFGTLVRSTLSGSTRKLFSVPYCEGRDADAFESLQVLPDASGAVFAGDCSAPHDLFSVGPDGSALTRITSTPADEIDPALSPDGSLVAFTRVDGGADCAGCDHVVWTMRLDGTAGRAVPLPSRSGNPILQDDRPSFSPDGARVVFARWDAPITGDGSALYTASTNGGGATPLHLVGADPAWGPSRIAFDAQGKVVTAKPDGSGRRTVATGDWIPAWSSDGRLALIKWGNVFSILLPATGKRLALPGLRVAGFEPPGLTWSPDGSHLAFTAADRDGVSDVWTIGADGSGLTRVTHGLDAEGTLSWR